MVKIPDDRPTFLSAIEKSKQNLGVNLAEVFNPKRSLSLDKIKNFSLYITKYSR